MKKHLIYSIFLLAIGLSFTPVAHAKMYMYLTNEEMTVFGDRIKFWHGDTLDGPVHSNSCMAISSCVVVLDSITSTCPDIPLDSILCPPYFTIRYAPTVLMEFEARHLRPMAIAQGHFYNLPNKVYSARFSPGQVHMAQWERGMFPDTLTNSWTIELSSPTAIFVDGPLDLWGIVGGEVTIGASGTVRILDDIRYEDANQYGRWIDPGATHTSYLGIISEADIKIANTPANGRWNSGGLGMDQTNQDSTSVCITASLVALGESFTFEQQNDPDSGYVCTTPCNCGSNGQGGGPDNRGMIYLLGSIAQMRRGYVHRSTCSSTGYLKSYHFDQRLRHHIPPGLFFGSDSIHVPQRIDFGDVVIGNTATDTADVHCEDAITLGSVYASYPFHAVRLAPYESQDFHIPVHFSPPRAGSFSGMLTLGLEGRLFQIPIRGRGVHAAAPPTALNVSPNPFNLTTTIRYSIPDAGAAKLVLFDILGRVVREFDLSGQSGDRAISFNGANLATGVYFVRLETGGQVATRKVLLLK